jgi:hypothetical protein
LWEAQGRGKPRRWTEEDMTHLDEIIRNDEKTHTSQQLAGELSKNRKVNLSAGYLRNLLKKGIRWKRTRQSHRRKQDITQKTIRQAELQILEHVFAAGAVDLCYLDESGFCPWSGTSYSYYFRGEQKRQEQAKSRGKRISMLGIWQPMMAFIYTLAVGSLKSQHML